MMPIKEFIPKINRSYLRIVLYKYLFLIAKVKKPFRSKCPRSDPIQKYFAYVKSPSKSTAWADGPRKTAKWPFSAS